MPSSQLYDGAIAELTEPEQTALSDALDRIRTAGGPVGGAGAQIVTNVEAEASLVGDGSVSDPAELARFLSGLAAIGGCSDVKTAYEGICARFWLRGAEVDRMRIGRPLLRYTTTDGIEAIGERVGMDDLWVAAVKDEPEWAVSELAVEWHTRDRSNASLVADDLPVFATFDEPGAGGPSVDRTDARAVADALALPAHHPTAIMELAYDPDDVEDIRRPTVADAIWFDGFRPVTDPDAAYGLTGARGGQNPQPEVVHRNRDLGCVRELPRFVGVI